MSIFPIGELFPNSGYSQSAQSPHRNASHTENTTSSERANSAASQHSDSNAPENTRSSNSPGELTAQEQREIQELSARDREVRAHEAAHKAAGGSLTGPAQYTYELGPNGKRYATGGEVSINTSPVRGDPQATLQKANQIRAAANAPVNPSSQDRSVAAKASSMAAEARRQLLAEQQNPTQPSFPNEADKAESTSSGLESRKANTDTVSHPSISTTDHRVRNSQLNTYRSIAQAIHSTDRPQFRTIV